MKTCKTCIYRNGFGHCQSGKITEYYPGIPKDEKARMLIYSYFEGGTFWVGEKFGCVHHQEKIASEEGKQ